MATFPSLIQLTTLSSNVALWLGRHRGLLVLDRVESLKEILAERIAKSPGECLSLNG